MADAGFFKTLGEVETPEELLSSLNLYNKRIDGNFWLELASIYLQQNLVDEATKCYREAILLEKSPKITELYFLKVTDCHQKHGNVDKAIEFLRTAYETFKNTRILSLKVYLKYVELIDDMVEIEKVLETAYTQHPKEYIAVKLLMVKMHNKKITTKSFETFITKHQSITIAKLELQYLLQTTEIAGTKEAIQNNWYLNHLTKFPSKFSCDYITWVAKTFGAVRSRQAFLIAFKIHPTIGVINQQIAIESEHQKTPYVNQLLIIGRGEIFGPADPLLLIESIKVHLSQVVGLRKLTQDCLMKYNLEQLDDFLEAYEQTVVCDICKKLKKGETMS